MSNRSPPRHDPYHLAAFVACAVGQLFSVIIYIYFVNGHDATQEVLFGGSKKELFALNRTLWIHPSYHGQNMWFMVQVFAFLWIIYGFTTIFRKEPSSGEYLYRSPSVIPTATYTCWAVSVLCFVALPFSVLRWYPVFVFPFVFTSACFAFCAIYNTALNLARVKPILRREGLKVDLMLAPGLALGGPSSFAALGTYQCVVILCRMFVTEMELFSEPTACTIGLVIISLIQLSAFVVETWFLDGYVREMNGHYVFVAILLGFIHANPKVPADSFFYKYNLAMIVFSALFFVVRNVIAQRRQFLDNKAAAEKEEEERKKDWRKRRREEAENRAGNDGRKYDRKAENKEFYAFDNPIYV